MYRGETIQKYIQYTPHPPRRQSWEVKQEKSEGSQSSNMKTWAFPSEETKPGFSVGPTPGGITGHDPWNFQ